MIIGKYEINIVNDLYLINLKKMDIILNIFQIGFYKSIALFYVEFLNIRLEIHKSIKIKNKWY